MTRLTILVILVCARSTHAIGLGNRQFSDADIGSSPLCASTEKRQEIIVSPVEEYGRAVGKIIVRMACIHHYFHSKTELFYGQLPPGVEENAGDIFIVRSPFNAYISREKRLSGTVTPEPLFDVVDGNLTVAAPDFVDKIDYDAFYDQIHPINLLLVVAERDNSTAEVCRRFYYLKRSDNT